MAAILNFKMAFKMAERRISKNSIIIATTLMVLITGTKPVSRQARER